MMFGDHAIYVWGSYAATAAVLAWQAWQPVLRMRRLSARLHTHPASLSPHSTGTDGTQYRGDGT